MGRVLVLAMKTITLISLLFLAAVSSGQTVNDLRPTVTMKEYVDMQSEWQQRIFAIQIANINDNVNKANAVNDKRLDGMNEFRQTLQDSNKTYVTKTDLFGWIIALVATFFSYANYMRNKPKKEAA